MAENLKVDVVQLPSKDTKFYNLTQEPPTVYVDTWSPTTSGSDVRIKLGDIIDRTGDEQVARLALTVVMTHDSFLKLTTALNAVADFLRLAYGGDAPTTANLPLERQAELVAMYSPKS